MREINFSPEKPKFRDTLTFRETKDDKGRKNFWMEFSSGDDEESEAYNKAIERVIKREFGNKYPLHILEHEDTVDVNRGGRHLWKVVGIGSKEELEGIEEEINRHAREIYFRAKQRSKMNESVAA